MSNFWGAVQTNSSFQTTFFNDFCGRSPRYVFCVANNLRSLGFARESLNISDDLSYTFPHWKYQASLLSALFHLPFEACACGVVEGAGGELAGDL